MRTSSLPRDMRLPERYSNGYRQKAYNVRIKQGSLERIVNIIDFIKAANRSYNKPHIDSIKLFRQLKWKLAKENDVHPYPHKAVYEYYTDAIEREKTQIFVLHSEQIVSIADFLKEIVSQEHKCEHRKHFQKLLIEKLPDAEPMLYRTGWGDEGLLVAVLVEEIIAGLHLLSTVEQWPVFERKEDKKPYLNSLDRIREYAGMRYGKSFYAKLDQIEQDIKESELIPNSKSKIYKSIYIRLILALSNLLFGRKNGGLSPTYGAKDIAQDIMMQVFNTDAKHYSLPDDLPNNLHKFRKSKLLGFYIYN